MIKGETYSTLRIRVGKKLTHVEKNVTLLSTGQPQRDGSYWMDFKRERPSNEQKETFCVNSKFIL
ncbi:hypothetical protein [Flectobacillus roseus]|uniref:hypothetical protein n=1 Tax=Flectobacillus roseus TaxID=502259 RepID=UPI0014122E2D|nr:hypothetical protein [Flectobacillus roseus]MDI9872125.1 hypothetical protein [Flectobacillus roseus]NBA77289.1 hypothetical protein [Emticicia sp. ODNR4P]